MYARDHGAIATPIGTVTVTASGDQLVGLRIGGDTADIGTPASQTVRLALGQLAQWFAGERRSFDVPLAPAATPRGRELRAALVAVGYGETESYGSFAARLGSSARAIGQLCARNPFPIIVPCHRILGAGGALAHYSAGNGPVTKQWLLDFERRNPRE